MKRGQVSVEFISIFGFVFLMTIPLLIVFFDTSNSVQDNLAQNHIHNFEVKIVDKAQTIYYLGSPSQTTIQVYFPEHIEYIRFVPASATSLSAIEVGFLTQNNDINNLQWASYVNLTGTLSTAKGPHFIKIEALGDKVSITD